MRALLLLLLLGAVLPWAAQGFAAPRTALVKVCA